jgi:hypothetical protein
MKPPGKSENHVGTGDASDRIRKKFASGLPGLHARTNSLELALWVLRASKDGGIAPSLTAREIHSILRHLEVACSQISISVALSRAADKEVTQDSRSSGIHYGVSHRGRELLDRTDPTNGVEVWHVEQGSKWTSWSRLEDLSKSYTGEVLITDPYYGQRSLHSLGILAERGDPVRLLTSQPTGRRGVNAASLRIEATDFMQQNRNVQIRAIPPPAPFHDRYILSDNALTMLGHGLEGLGEKEAFVIRLARTVVPDLLATLHAEFAARWTGAVPI